MFPPDAFGLAGDSAVWEKVWAQVLGLQRVLLFQWCFWCGRAMDVSSLNVFECMCATCFMSNNQKGIATKRIMRANMGNNYLKADQPT